MPTDRLIQMFKLSDINKDKFLDPKEFSTLVQSFMPDADQMKVNMLFDEIDTNQDKRISMDEFMAKLDPKIVDALKK